jgi:multiple sugar transport system permease protein
MSSSTTGIKNNDGSKSLDGRTQNRVGWAMLAPAVLLLLVFIIIPVVLAFGLAFTDAQLISTKAISFTGLSNFQRLFSNPTFWRALLNVSLFSLVVVPLQAGLGLFLAVLINKKVRSSVFFRTVYFLPVVTSMVVVSLLWMFIYQNNGMLNVLLEKITFGHWTPVDWLNDSRVALAAIIVMSIWQAVGQHMLIWLSGLQTIPGELYEAAALDGATGWKSFANVTWPCLRSTRNMILITITIAAMGLFTQVSVMTQGGPRDSTTTVVFEAVRSGFKQQEMGYASAITLVFFMLILVITGIQRLLTREK